MGRVEHRQERGARLFLYPSLWEPLFAWSIHHNDRNPQTHLLLLSSYPLFLLSLHSATLCFSAYFTVESRPTAVIELIRLYIEASHTEIAYWLTITILSMHSWLWQQAQTHTVLRRPSPPPRVILPCTSFVVFLTLPQAIHMSIACEYWSMRLGYCNLFSLHSKEPIQDTYTQRSSRKMHTCILDCSVCLWLDNVTLNRGQNLRIYVYFYFTSHISFVFVCTALFT